MHCSKSNPGNKFITVKRVHHAQSFSQHRPITKPAVFRHKETNGKRKHGFNMVYDRGKTASRKELVISVSPLP